MRGASIVAAALAAVVLAGCGATHTVTRTVTVERSAAGEQRLFGRIASLRREGPRYELRFDPAWYLSGVTANVALAEDTGSRCRPAACPPVPDDVYRVDESHRLYTFLVPAGVRGTVVTKHGQIVGGFPATTITAAQLAELVAGTSRLKLSEPLASGVWIRVHGDTVQTFAQQYRP